MKKISMLAAAALAVVSTTAHASTTFDPATGTGFLAKGDVQLTLGWNNRALQNGADSLVVTYVGETVTERTWICTNSNNENTQERDRTTTTSIQGVVDAVARERNQITGFILSGYEGPATTTSTTEGNPLNSCPSGPWSLTTPAGDPVPVGSPTGGLRVNNEDLLMAP
jgi:hypothetical protein